VVVGPAVGVDAAAIDYGNCLLLAKTDPITFVTEDIGFYAVHINANDIAVMGGIPKWFLATILLPEKRATTEMAESIFKGLHRACKSLKISLCGGHTEVTSGIDRPIVVGQMLGEVNKKKLVTSTGARPGDTLILTKGIAIEGTSILARERGVELRKAFSSRFVERCKKLTRRPGISVVKDAMTAIKYGRVHAMHDPTEGGLATGLHELAMASEVGILVRADHIPILPEFRRLCDYFRLNPLGVIASGALLIAVHPRDTLRLINGLATTRIPAWMIGQVTTKRNGIKLLERGKKRLVPLFESDEICRIL